MDAFHYIDMFATKGVEYLLVIAFLAAIVPFWIWLQRSSSEERPRRLVLETGAGLALMQRPFAPADVLIDAGHTWVRPARAPGLLAVGIDNLVTEVLGDLDAIEVPPAGTPLKVGDPLFTLRLGERAWVLPAPVDGVVAKIDDDAIARPRSIIADPYGGEWLTLEPGESTPEPGRLREGERANAWLDDEFDRLIDLLTSHPAQATPYFADGAYPAVGVLARTDDALWQAFQDHFLTQQRNE
ncbi:MAG: hypothetical protein P1V51_02710 [Deltaproteobacteria bacterium]|nr:hypothetical protein [Deltaproteobacteria bacterium]